MSGMLTNIDYNHELIDQAGLRVYEEMSNGDATVQAALLAVTLPILSADWRVDPASDSVEDKTIAEWVWDQLNNMTRPFHEFMEEALEYLVYGRYLFEIVYKLEADGKIGLKKLAPRMPSTVMAWQTSTGQDGITHRVRFRHSCGRTARSRAGANGRPAQPPHTQLIMSNTRRAHWCWHPTTSTSPTAYST